MVRRKFGHPCAEKEARLRPQQQLSGGTGCVTSRMHGAYVCGGRFDMTLIEARRKLFDGVRGRRMSPDLANMAKPSAVTFFR